jgi:F-type H+-transporting ATPase subunit a
MANPVEQFTIKPIVPIQVGGLDLSFTNSSLYMVLAVIVSTVLLTSAMKKRALIPGRMQSVAEILFEFVASVLRDNAGAGSQKYFPLIFSVFMFVLFGNVLGLTPYSFTYTSHIIVTFGLAAALFVGITIIGFMRHGFGYLRMFFPHGAPIASAPILVIIELFSYMFCPFSLAVRLAANMTVGHIMLKILAGFIVSLGIFGFVPFAGVVCAMVLEFGIACLQAYIFTVLSCIYLHDALHMH